MQTVLESTALQFTFISANLKRHITGLTHEDSLLQLPFRGNCLNWVMGHIVASRNLIYKMTGGTPFWTDEEAAMYARGSDAITPENAHLAQRFEDLVATYDRVQPVMLETILGLTDADLAKPWRDNDVYHWLVRYAQHEAYHVGQTEILRQLTGKNDVV